MGVSSSTLSPAAQAFWGSVIRHVLTAIAGMLVTHGYVSPASSTTYVEELVGVLLQAGVMAWANRIIYWHQIVAAVGRAMPEGVTHQQVCAKVAELKAVDALPSVFTQTPPLTSESHEAHT